MNWNNRITRSLNIEYPFVQAPMLNVTTPSMIAAASEGGCLGMLPLAYYGYEKAKAAIGSVKELTSKPFGVNMFAYERPESIPLKSTPVLEAFYNQYGLPFFQQIPQTDPFPYYTELIDFNTPVIIKL